MRKVYTVKRVRFADVDTEGFWESIPAAALTERPWEEFTYHPATNARLVMSEKGFHLLMTSRESFLRAEETNLNAGVCEDSCMEFFFMPAPEKSKSYVNIEMNPKGVYHCGMGTGRHERWFPSTEANRCLNIKAGTETGKVECVETEQLWWVRYDLPWVYLDSLFGKDTYESGKVMRGNFYKCGDSTVHVHYNTWSGIGLPKPDYHCPDWFGELVIE